MIAKANDLIRVAAAGAACATALSHGRGEVDFRLPREWKGQVPKPATHAAALGVLTSDELDLVACAYRDTGRLKRGADALARLCAYVEAGQLWVARNPGKPLSKGPYGAAITDLLDAVTFGLVEEGRLRF